MATGLNNSQSQSHMDTINEDEFDIHVVAYRSFQQIFVPRGLAKLEKILETWTAETDKEVQARLVKRLERKPSSKISEIYDCYVTVTVR
ncbi:hypothetical protein MPTK1_3g16780 [Marchantia polymorpha subsp. ruderalis]|uniref:Uncharacterized protein n=2 Tax=Marchantia polymorpha TaxID=3197 RepID=A0AAF6B1L0_MARPO|nr:hypothetical protein MARPO_0039s0117 [Marchantia polymorpha]BBN05894.1 hypothetical protein Mp_3g16780 [Marchantia polymorpha subsp. ruderalis]|eukprot:PTQ40631.1 hypothetical protein MARPO_0039s0117 [Marchantia polymorpha]